MQLIIRSTLQYKKQLFLLFIIVFIQALSQLLLPTLMGKIVDDGVVVGNISYIWQVGFIMLGVAGVGVIMSILMSYYAAHIAMSVGRDLRHAIFSQVTHFNFSQFEQFGTGSLITRTTNDLTQIQQALVMILRLFLTAPFMLFGGFIMAFTKDFYLALTILTVIPFIILAVLFVLKKGYPLFQKIQKRLDRLNVVLRENLTGVRVIRAFTREKDERRRLQRANEDLTSVSIHVNRLMALAMPLMMFMMNVVIVLVIWFGSIRIDQDMMHIGDLMAFIQYVMLILIALMMASMMFVIVPRASVSASRVRKVLQTELEEERGGKRITAPIDQVSLDQVSFRYQGAQKLALADITFSTKKGEITAIIGGTGSGKTTLVHLLLKLYNFESGAIHINDVPIEELDTKDLRNRIGYVPQQAFLFSGTIRENLLYGNATATEEDVLKAATIAQANDFIMDMPLGYDTKIEQGGANLSGGQKQRLSIARAIVKKPDLFIFDDSFSALDYETDYRLRRALQPIIKNRLTFIIAQRVNSVKHADQIVVLDEGRIAGIGTHEQLLARNEVYKEIVASQLGKEDSG